MKKVSIVFILFALITISSCEKLNLNNLVLDNQSDFDVEIKLETGRTNDDGSIAWDEFQVGAKSSQSVDVGDNTVYVKGYSPSDVVDMDFQESKRKIVFTNK